MPESRFAAARRALDEVAPSTDLWAAAEQRAGSPALTANVLRRSRWRWAVAAGLVAAPVLAVLALWPDPDNEVPVDAAGTTTAPPSVITVPSDGGMCGYGLSGDPIVILPGPADPPLLPGDRSVERVQHVELGGLAAEIHVPGFVVIDLVGERVEDVQLDRGTAQAWITEAFVQVRWSTGSQERCESFTVTVGGGSVDENRAAAIDLADRVLLPSDLASPTGGSEEFHAIWPETDPSEVSANEPWASSQSMTALTFAREVLGWEDASHDVESSEPLEDGLGGALIAVTSASREASVQVFVHPMVADGYRVSGLAPPYEYSASVLVQGRQASVSMGWIPAEHGASSCAAEFAYAGRRANAPLGQTVDLGFDPDTQGAVIVLCRNDAGQVVTGWGTALPAGDFAAG